MNKFDDFLNQEHVDESIISSVKDWLSKGKDFASSVWTAVKREKRETQEAAKILYRMFKSEDVSDNEKKFLKAQALDLCKVLPLIAISGIPIPVPITPFLIVLGEKYGFSILPKENSHLLQGI
jgi:hypothetical protein